MNPLFVKGASPNSRLLVCVGLSLLLMFLDHRNYLDEVRKQVALVATPFYYLMSFPVSTANWLSEGLATRTRLVRENRHLSQENRQLRARLQRFEDLQRENNRLHRLLGASPKTGSRMLVAQILSVDLSAHSRKLVINKGTWHEVREGLPVLDATGVVGQVVRANRFSAVVMLITDMKHTLPIQVVRTGVRTLAEGTGNADHLSLLYLPKTAEIMVGDRIITSGQGEKFPPGYPVGVVTQMESADGEPFTRAVVTPGARLDRNREVLLLWPAANVPSAPGAEANPM